LHPQERRPDIFACKKDKNASLIVLRDPTTIIDLKKYKKTAEKYNKQVL